MKQIPTIAICALLMLSGIAGARAEPSQPPEPADSAAVASAGAHPYGPFELRASDVAPVVVPLCGDVSESPDETLFEGSATLDGARCVESDGFEALLQSEEAPTHAPVLGIDLPF